MILYMLWVSIKNWHKSDRQPLFSKCMILRPIKDNRNAMQAKLIINFGKSVPNYLNFLV